MTQILKADLQNKMIQKRKARPGTFNDYKEISAG